ncbi:MAG TPA: DEAD/DEAH box helicase, partial [Stellaceae bacterium]|nr:DEAD/DEAH box helicase [Stellaceae bacterium]
MPGGAANSWPETTPGPAAAAGRVKVLLPLPLPAPLDYRLPDGAAMARPGSFVRVELGSRRLVGVVWEAPADGGELPADRLKCVIDVLPAPLLRPELRRFIDRVAGYTLAAPGAVLRMAMSVEEALLPPPPRRLYAATQAGLAALAESAGSRLTPARQRVLETLRDGAAGTGAEVARRAGCTTGVLRGLVAAGLVAELLVPDEPQPAPVEWDAAGPALSPDQRRAAQRLIERAEAGGFNVTVLDGVTGAGKTETYFTAIAATLAAGRQVLVLLPEIALGAQWFERFHRRFGTAPAEWHSDLRDAARRDTWRAVAAGRARVVVGAR